MKRLALTLATAVLASGCIIGDDDDDHFVGVGSAIVYWDFIRNAPAQGGTGTVLYDVEPRGRRDRSCVQSGVEVVTIDVAGLQQFVVDCVYQGVQGATLDGLPAGSLSARIRGWRGQRRRARHDRRAAGLRRPGDGSGHHRRGSGARADRSVRGSRVRPGADPLRVLRARPTYPDISFELFDGFGTRIDAASRRLLGPAAGARVHRRPRPRQLHRPDAGHRHPGAVRRPDRVRLLRAAVRSLRPRGGGRGSS